MPKTADTHYTEPLEKTTFGKRYYVVDDAKHVWGADVEYDDAVRLRERVAGNLWSKTPAVREMPADPKMRAKIISLVRGPDNLPVQQAQSTAQAATELERELLAAPASEGTPDLAATNGSGEKHDEGSGDDGDDDDLADLLNS